MTECPLRLDMCGLHCRNSIRWFTWQWGSARVHANLLLFVIAAIIPALNNEYSNNVVSGRETPLGVPVAAAAASEVSKTNHVGPLPLSASDAMRHTLGILYPEKVRDLRRLSHLPNKFSAVYTSKPKTLCDQSKYLCHVNRMQNPNMKPVSLVEEENDKGSRVAFGIPILPLGSPKPLTDLERDATLSNGLAQSDIPRFRSADFALPTNNKSGVPRRLYTMDIDHPENGVEEGNNALTSRGIIEKAEPKYAPSFIQVHQLSSLDSEFLPLRIKPTFHDFREEVNNLQQQRPSETDTNAVFADLLRFFKVDVVPAALWWVQRSVTVLRRKGPILLEKAGYKGFGERHGYV